MASILKHKNGWRVQIRKKGVNKSAIFRTKPEAQVWANETERAIDAGTYEEIIDVPFSFIIDKYIREITIQKKGAKAETLRLKRLLDMPIADVSIIDLTEQDFENWRDERLKNVSPASVLREWNTLSNIMTVAINKWKFIKENPLKNIDKPATPKERSRRYSDEEIERLVYVSNYDFNYPPTTSRSRTAAAMLFAIETAMRAGEICNATWQDIDLKKRILHIPTSKNGHSRNVPLSTLALKIINHLALVKEEGKNRIFKITAGTLDTTFRELKALAGLDDADLHFHDTRREALSRLSKKVEVMTLAKISGHRDIKILLNTYYAPDMAEIAKLLD